MSSKLSFSSRFSVTSRYSASSTPSRSPSSSSTKPVDRRTLRIGPGLALAPELVEGILLLAVDRDDLVDAGHRDHRLDARLQARELEHARLLLQQPVDVHQAPDRGAVDVGHRLQIDHHL